MSESDEQQAPPPEEEPSKPLSRAARRRAALRQLQESIGQGHARIAEAVADVLAALDVKDARMAAADQADGTAAEGVRAMLREGQSVDQVVELLHGRVTQADVQRYAAVDVLAAQEAIESDRVPYRDRPDSEPADGQPAAVVEPTG